MMVSFVTDAIVQYPPALVASPAGDLHSCIILSPPPRLQAFPERKKVVLPYNSNCRHRSRAKRAGAALPALSLHNLFLVRPALCRKLHPEAGQQLLLPAADLHLGHAQRPPRSPPGSCPGSTAGRMQLPVPLRSMPRRWPRTGSAAPSAPPPAPPPGSPSSSPSSPPVRDRGACPAPRARAARSGETPSSRRHLLHAGGGPARLPGAAGPPPAWALAGPGPAAPGTPAPRPPPGTAPASPPRSPAPRRWRTAPPGPGRSAPPPAPAPRTRPGTGPRTPRPLPPEPPGAQVGQAPGCPPPRRSGAFPPGAGARPHPLGRKALGQGHAGALPRGGGHPHAVAEALHHREAQPRPLLAAGGEQGLHGLLHVGDAPALVPHPHHGLAPRRTALPLCTPSPSRSR